MMVKASERKETMKHFVIMPVVIMVLCLAWTWPGALNGADEGYQAVTAKDPEIPVDQLELLLKPLTKAELVGEADAWQALLKAKAQAISDKEIARMKANEAIDTAEEVVDAVEDAKEAAESGDAKEAQEALDAVKKAQEEAKKSEDEVKQSKGAEEAVDEATKETGDPKVEDIKSEDIKDTDKVDAVTETAKKDVEKQEKIKEKLVEDVAKMRLQQTALMDRLNAVLAALEDKGGDVTEYNNYIKGAVSTGVEVDVTDASATMTAITTWLKSEQGGIRWGINIAKFIGTLIGFWILAILCRKIMAKALKAWKNVSEILRTFMLKTTFRLVMAIGVIMALGALEINIGPVMAVIGAAGFVVAFALQGTLSNFASGIMIMFYRPFDVGDVVDVAGVLGKVDSMNLVSTHIKTPDNKSVTVPNNAIWGGVITNATDSAIRRVDMMFGIGYSDSIPKAQEVLEALVKAHPKVLDTPETVIQVHELADSSVNFVCRPWCNTADYWDVFWDLTRQVKEKFDQEGISIPFPQQDVHVFKEQAE